LNSSRIGSQVAILDLTRTKIHAGCLENAELPAPEKDAEGDQVVATMADVARRAGVTKSTVSHVMNRTRTVSQETVAAVERAMDELGYVPNTLARSLARATTDTVGLAISSISNIYFSDIIQAVEKACTRLGLMVFLADTADDPEQELKLVRALHQRRVDGIILAPSADPKQSAIGYLRENDIPCVLLDRLVSREFDQIGVENTNAVRQLVNHLVWHGHWRIGMLSNQSGLATTLERIDGYRLGLSANGIAWDEALLEAGSGDTAANIQATLRLLDLRDRPTAIVAGNNLSTICAMRAIRERRLRIPQDIALVGFDDFDWADLFEPRLTLIAQPVAQIGEKAARMLVERIADRSLPPRTVRLEPSLVLRESCGRA
jgi:LacI family transcriptional regulator